MDLYSRLRRKSSLTENLLPCIIYRASKQCGCSSMAELQLPKLTTRVRFPSSAPRTTAFIAQSVERIHGKDEVTSSILVKGSNKRAPRKTGSFSVEKNNITKQHVFVPWMRSAVADLRRGSGRDKSSKKHEA